MQWIRRVSIVLHHCVDFPEHNFTNNIDRTEMLVELLKPGVSPDVENKAGQSAKALAAENARYNLSVTYFQLILLSFIICTSTLLDVLNSE